MPFERGHILGDYEVLGQLGSGGIGEVYKVRHVISQRTEAMKLLRADRTGGELPQRFLREIRVLASLSHPSIARLHTAFNVDDQIAMVMEFIEGEDLHWKLHRQWPGRAVEGIEYICQVLSALEYAHARDVIHRDIKPSNIMITPDRQAMLLDFGMAFKAADLSVTRPGNILGSLHYMSPEQVRGERVDARSDLYSTGVTLYEIVTGGRPFEGKNEYEVMTAQLREQAKWPGDVDPAIPYGLSTILMKALAKNPDDRYQNAADFLVALTHISWTKRRPCTRWRSNLARSTRHRTAPSHLPDRRSASQDRSLRSPRAARSIHRSSTRSAASSLHSSVRLQRWW